MRRFSATVRLLNGRGNWKLRARPEPRALDAPAARPVSCPSNRTLPASLRSVPQMQFTRVLLPEPLGPIRPTPLAGADIEFDPSSATKPPNRLPS